MNSEGIMVHKKFILNPHSHSIILLKTGKGAAV